MKTLTAKDKRRIYDWMRHRRLALLVPDKRRYPAAGLATGPYIAVYRSLNCLVSDYYQGGKRIECRNSPVFERFVNLHGRPL